MLEGESTLYKHPRATTLYLTIPSNIVKDSQFDWQKGNKVKLRYDPDKKELIVTKREALCE